MFNTSSIVAPANVASTTDASTERAKRVHKRKPWVKTLCIAVATIAATCLSFASANAQGTTPQPTPGVEDVASITLSSDKGSVVAGGVSSTVHQAKLTATAKNKDGKVLSGKSISFTVTNADVSSASDEIGSVSSPNANSGSPLTVTTGGDGTTPEVTFTSSRVIGASNIIKASSNGKERKSLNRRDAKRRRENRSGASTRSAKPTLLFLCASASLRFHFSAFNVKDL